MEDLGSENYDQRLYENLYGPETENPRETTATLARRQIMDVNTVRTFSLLFYFQSTQSVFQVLCQSDMDASVRKLFKPVLAQCVTYTQRKTVLGGNYPGMVVAIDC